MITSNYVTTNGSTQYDTRKATLWVTPADAGTTDASVYFRRESDAPIRIPEPGFTTAKTAACGASSPQ